MKIKKIVARKIPDSKNIIEITVNRKYKCYTTYLNSEIKIDDAINFLNKLKNFKDIKIEEFSDLYYLEDLIDKISNNGIYALQGAILKALSDNKVWEFLNSKVDKMPILWGNCIGNIDIQEFLVIPKVNDFFDSVFTNNYVYKRVGKDIIKKRNSDGAWSPDLNNVSVLDVLSKNIDIASKDLGFDIKIGLNINANSLYQKDKYNYKNFSNERKEKQLTKDEQIDFINSLVEYYNIFYVEGPLINNDINSFNKIKSKLVSINLDNINILREFKDNIKAIAININKIGSLITAKEFIDYANKNEIIPIISSCFETTDDLIVHLAVAWEVPFIKLGLFGKERFAKINALINIEKEIKG